jgi:hypothetical protein
VLQFDGPKEIKALEKELYKPIEKIRLEELLPKMNFPAGQEWAIIDKNGNILNFCSEVYFPKLNSEIYPIVEDGLKQNGLKFKKKINIIGGVKFYVSYIIMERAKSITVNDVFPKLSIFNSYDGTVKLRKEFGFYKLLCSNGLSRPTEKTSTVSFKHTSGNDLKIEEVIKITKDFLLDSKNDMAVFDRMNRKSADMRSLRSVAKKATLAKHVVKVAEDRFKLETQGKVNYLNEHNESVTSNGTPSTMFAVYNALNWAIYSCNQKELPEKKLEKDHKILELIEHTV